MEERLDGLSGDGIGAFEEDIYLVGPEGCLDRGLIASVAVTRVRRFRTGFPCPWPADWLVPLLAKTLAAMASRTC